MVTDTLGLVMKAFIVIGAVMTMAGYAVLLERKVAARVQGRPGPNRTQIPILGSIPVIGTFLTRLGVFQPAADGLKFLFKEDPLPGHVNKFYYVLAPMVAFIPAMLTMTVLPFGAVTDPVTGATSPIVLADLDIGILFILAVSSLGVYGIILGGWSSNSKYPFLGGVRASAQMISYEIALGLSILPVFLWFGGTLNLFNVVEGQSQVWTALVQPVSALIFLIALFAETNRLPFDMPESETDLVAGYNTEYGAFKFGLFFVGEYTHIIIGSGVFVVLFLGGWTLPFITLPAGMVGAVLSVLIFLAKVFCIVFFFMWVRWTLPRFRYDQVMNLGWNKLLPLAIGNLVFYAIVIAVIEQLN
ncbi:MAG: NADH-quinone oxidoreductase subunit NuoH [Opitutales bacterium]|nr:NADH-quinone oxidoreductase subunit NuoH [Opitutales bacterium]